MKKNSPTGKKLQNRLIHRGKRQEKGVKSERKKHKKGRKTHVSSDLLVSIEYLAMPNTSFLPLSRDVRA